MPTAGAGTGTISLSRVLTALSYALDLTEGHPRGHTARSCLIGMRLASVIGLPPDRQSDLFYALLLKDAGCSSNATRVHQLFGGSDHEAKRAVWLRDWRRLRDQVGYALEYVEPDGTLVQRFRRFARLAMLGPRGGRELFQIRCDRGAEIARAIGFGPRVADAVRAMDEHWDGWGYPAGLRGDAIPIEARIIGLAQVLEIFVTEHGAERALEVARERRGRWFDPALVDASRALAEAPAFWSALAADDLEAAVADVEPVAHVVTADGARLDRIAQAFAWVIDAKSAFTYEHSERMAAVARTLAVRMGLDQVDTLWRTALLHDIGKLAVPNRILDKPGRLTAEEWVAVRAHPRHTFDILTRVPGFQDTALEASLHHERLDGKGYYRGLESAALSTAARVMAVADVYDALRADRPYRAGLPMDRAMAIITADAGTAFCPDCVAALGDVAGGVALERKYVA